MRHESTSRPDLEQLANNRRQPFSGWKLAANRNLQLFKTYSIGQVTRRIIKQVRNRIGMRYVPGSRSAPASVSDQSVFAWLFGQHSSHQKLSPVELQSGSIELLNQRYELGAPIDWRANLTPRPDHLWRFQLHYHEYLLDLVSDYPDSPTWDLAWESIDHWIAKNRPADNSVHDDAWHPYCISRRIPVWMQLTAVQPQTENRQSVLDSIFSQADYLSRNLETDLRGNHLIENLRHLPWPGAFSGARWPVGGEISRCNICAKNLSFRFLKVVNTMSEVRCTNVWFFQTCFKSPLFSKKVFPELNRQCLDYSQRMFGFLSAIKHPDGEIPLFSDSCFGEGPTIAQIQLLADQAGIEVASSSQSASIVGDYWIFQSNEDHLVFDAGQVAAKDCRVMPIVTS